MKIYIAGKIAGDPNYAAKFTSFAEILTKRGFIVLSPTVMPEGMRPGDYMRICFAMIDVADAVFFIPDWMESQGARLERLYCNYTEKAIIRDLGLV